MKALLQHISRHCAQKLLRPWRNLYEVTKIPFTSCDKASDVCDKSLATVIFPEKLKIAKVMPFYKRDDITLMDNYRPVSLLTSISKVFEKVVSTQLYEYFDKHNLFRSSQYGFRKKHSTEMAGLELTDRIL